MEQEVEHESMGVSVSEALNEGATSYGYMSESETISVRPDILDFAGIDSEAGCSNNSDLLSDRCEFYDEVFVEEKGETDRSGTAIVSDSDNISESSVSVSRNIIKKK